MGQYVALEGVDGSGKSTVASALREALEASGETVVSVREPGGTPVGEVVRELLLDTETLDVWAEVFLFAAQRAELVREVVRPALDDGSWVLSDRTYYSSIAYQGQARGLGMRRIRELNELGLAGTLPDHVFVLDVEPEVALARQGRPDRIGGQGVEFQDAVRSGYLELGVSDPKVSILNGALGVDELVGEILARTR